MLRRLQAECNACISQQSRAETSMTLFSTLLELSFLSSAHGEYTITFTPTLFSKVSCFVSTQAVFDSVMLCPPSTCKQGPRAIFTVAECSHSCAFSILDTILPPVGNRIQARTQPNTLPSGHLIWSEAEAEPNRRLYQTSRSYRATHRQQWRKTLRTTSRVPSRCVLRR